jgi:hypothetical protein
MSIAIAEARERLLARIRVILPAYIASAIAAADAATGRTAASRSTKAPQAFFVGLNAIDQQWLVDLTPVIAVVETSGQVSQESIFDSQDETITLALYALHTVDRSNIEDAAQTVRILALCAAEVLQAHLPETLITADGSCWRCAIESSAVEEPQSVAEDMWSFSYGVELSATIRYRQDYSPMTLASGLKPLPSRQEDAFRASATLTATSSGVAGLVCASGASVTLQLTAGQLAATTALAVTWAGGSIPSAATCYVMRQTAPAASASGAVVSDTFAAAVGSVPLADDVEILIVTQITGTQAAATYRARIEVVP